MHEDIQVVLTPEVYLMQIQALNRELKKRDAEIERLTIQLEYEQGIRERLEERFGKLPEAPQEPVKKRRKRIQESFSPL